MELWLWCDYVVGFLRGERSRFMQNGKENYAVDINLLAMINK